MSFKSLLIVASLLVIGEISSVPSASFDSTSEALQNSEKPSHSDQPLDFLTRFLRNGQLMGAIQRIFRSVDAQARPTQADDARAFSIDEPPAEEEHVDSTSQWKSLLLGPSGVLTEIFNAVKDKVKDKMDSDKVSESMTQMQQDMTPEQLNFAKVFESFMQKAKTGNFDEPLPELPFIGICNRLNCGDIYKAVDEFRKSDFFSNFQTAMSLIHDPKGWDIIGDVLANPELIENFVGKNGADGLLPVNGPKAIPGEKDDLSEFGVDFSPAVDGVVTTVDKASQSTGGGEKTMPVISSSLDYYTALEKQPDEEAKVSIDFEDVDSEVAPKPKPSVGREDPNSLPEISESIDAIPQEYEYVVVQKPDEFVNGSVAVDAVEVVVVNGTSSGPKTDTKQREITSTSRRTTKVTTTPAPTTTVKTTPKRNFRRNNDYYAMYYDN